MADGKCIHLRRNGVFSSPNEQTHSGDMNRENQLSAVCGGLQANRCVRTGREPRSENKSTSSCGEVAGSGTAADGPIVSASQSGTPARIHEALSSVENHLESRVLVLYTGGTIGMVRNEAGGNVFRISKHHLMRQARWAYLGVIDNRSTSLWLPLAVALLSLPLDHS